MNPLWMPPGSGRLLMALAITGAAIFMWVTGRPMTQAQEVITTGVMSGNFVLRQIGSGASPPDGKPPQDLLRGTD